MTKAKVKDRPQAAELFGGTTTVAPPPPKAAPAKPKNEVAKVERLPAKPPPTDMLSVIAAAAANKDVDTSKMEALLRMQTEIMAERARMAFTRDFIAMQEELPTIDANGRIVIEGKLGKRGQNTPYPKYNDIHKAVKPILRRHGFALSYATEPSPSGDRLIVRTFLDHVEGHQRSSAFPLPAESSGSKNSAQAWGSAFSHGKRYGCVGLLDIISEAKEDRDDDGRRATAKGNPVEPEPESVVLVTAKQVVELTKAINDCGVGVAMFCNKYSVGHVSDLPAGLFDGAMAACHARKAERDRRQQADG